MSNFDQRPPETPSVPPTVAPPSTVPPPPPPSGGGQGSDAKERGKQAAGTATEEGKRVAGTAADQGKEVAHTAAAGAQQVAGEAAREIKDVAQTASNEARRLVEEARGEVRSQVSNQTERAAEGLRSISSQLQKAASGEPIEAGPVRDLAQQAGSTIDQLAERLSSDGIEGLAGDVSSFARRRPGLFLAGAATFGFVAGRMLRGAQSASQGQQGPGQVDAPPMGVGAQGAVAPPLPPTSTSAPHLGTATADSTGVVVIDDGDAVGIPPSSVPSTPSGGPR